MLHYLIRRILYTIPILLGVNLITFILFFWVNSPDDVARIHLGQKHITQESIENWKIQHGYNKPLFYNPHYSGIKKWTETLWVQKSLTLFTFHFGESDAGRDIVNDINMRMWPSLAIAVPTLIVSIWLNITIALSLILFRHTILKLVGLICCVILISISGLFYIIAGQYLFAKILLWVPISGYANGIDAWRFLILPIAIGVFSNIGSGTRWYRTLFIEEIGKDYVRTAQAKGLSEWQVLYKHVLPNALIPIITGVVALIPLLFMGSLIMESFFGIPGMGSYVIDAIQNQDFAIIRVMVFIGTFLYLIGLIATDIIYTWADPRVKFS